MDYIQKGTRAFHKANWALFLAGFITFANLYVTTITTNIFRSISRLTSCSKFISFSNYLCISGEFNNCQFVIRSMGKKIIDDDFYFATSVLTLALAFSPNFEIILVLRVVQGIVFAGLPAIAMAYLGEEMEPASLGAAMGLYISGNSVGDLVDELLLVP